MVNEVRFSTVDRDANKKTQNSGIMLPAAKNPTNTAETGYYGILKEIICLDYHEERSVVLFKGDWFLPRGSEMMGTSRASMWEGSVRKVMMIIFWLLRLKRSSI